MIVVTGLFEIADADVDRAAAVASEMAKATRVEDGCITYAFYRNVEDPSVFRVYEEWRDLDALSAHIETEHMARFRAQLADIEIVSRGVKRFTGSDIHPL